MPIQLVSGFKITSKEPIDDRLVVTSSNGRFEFDAVRYHDGLTVFTTPSQQYHILVDSSSYSTDAGWRQIFIDQSSGSFNLTGSINILSGSIAVSNGSFTGDLTGTASWANNVVSASYALNATSASYALNATSADSATSATSASYAQNAQNILPTLFQIPELLATGSGLIISSSLPAGQYNAIRIGNSELVDDYGGYFTFNIGTSQGWAFSGSLGGLITTLNKNAFRFYENLANYNFESDATDFTVYKSESNNDVATTAFNINRQTGLLYASGGASISGSTNIQNNLTVGGTLSADVSTLNSLTVTNGATIGGDLTVNGTTTYINVDNLLVEDKFILLNSGSTGNPSHEGGIIIQTSASAGDAFGTALFYDQEANRWMVARSSSVAANATSITVGETTDYIVTVSASAGAPTGAPVNFGDGGVGNYSLGQMYIQTNTSDIYIYA